MNQHVKVTFDFTNYNYGTYDLAVPAYLPIKNLIALVLDSLDISIFDVNTQIKVMTKGQLLVETTDLLIIKSLMEIFCYYRRKIDG